MIIGQRDTHIFHGWFRYNNRDDVLYSLIGTLQPAPDDNEGDESQEETIGSSCDEFTTEECTTENNLDFWGELESPLLGLLEIAGTLDFARGIMDFVVTGIEVPGVDPKLEGKIIAMSFTLSAQNLTWAGSFIHPKPDDNPDDNDSGQVEMMITPVSCLSHKLLCSSTVPANTPG
ncbi:hypothetical protein KJ836_03010 [Patescibacteria group bacterium]|nr:hypothetical protein [Patescibacteria group bacterium]